MGLSAEIANRGAEVEQRGLSTISFVGNASITGNLSVSGDLTVDDIAADVISATDVNASNGSIDNLASDDIVAANTVDTPVIKSASGTITANDEFEMQVGEQFFFDGGTAALPGIAPVRAGVRDPDSGIYSTIANTTQIASGGAIASHIDNISGLVADTSFTVNGVTTLVGALYLPERGSDPSAAANYSIVYSKDIAGKTELVVRFGTGLVQQIAVEP